MPMPKKKGTDLSALDSLMGGGDAESSGPMPDNEAAEGEAPAPKKDPAVLVASIQAQLNELASLLPTG